MTDTNLTPDLTPEQMTFLEDVATGAYNTLQNVLAQRNNPAKFQIKTPKSIEGQLIQELEGAQLIQRMGGNKLGLTGQGTKVWRKELTRRQTASREAAGNE